MKRRSITMASLLLVAGSVSSAQAVSLDQQQQQEVRELVRKTLIENPDILVEAMTELRNKEETAKKAAAEQALSKHQKALFDNPDSPVIGNPDAKLTFVMFTDYNCGYCKRQDPVIQKIIKDNPDIKVVVKNLPILGRESQQAAKYALASFYQDEKQYKAVNERLMAKPGRHSEESIHAAFEAEGIDIDTLKISDKVDEEIANNMKLAAELGIRGTPALVFSDRIVPGYVQENDLKDFIKNYL